MKVICSFFFIAFFNIISFGQYWSFGSGYEFLYNNDWNKATQLYNTARPFLENKQRLLEHGLNINVAHYGKLKQTERKFLSANYSFYEVKTINPFLTTRVAMHMILLDYNLKSSDLWSEHPLYFSYGAGIRTNLTTRNIVDDPSTDEAYPIYSGGIGLEMNVSASYDFQMPSGLFISPFVKCSLSPLYFSPTAEKTLALTQGMSTSKWSNMCVLQLGMQVAWPEKN